MLVGSSQPCSQSRAAGSVRLQAEGRRSLAEWLRHRGRPAVRRLPHREDTSTAALILLFVMFYKLGDALLGVMAHPFYVELGFSATEIASVVKTLGLVARSPAASLGGMGGQHPAASCRRFGSAACCRCSPT